MKDTCPVCGLIEKGVHTVPRCVIGEGEKQRAFDDQRLARFRDERFDKRDYPTVNTIVKCATDEPGVEATGVYGTYRLQINHVLSFHGKGYMPSLYKLPTDNWRGEHAGNGNVAKTWEEALEAGKIWLMERIEDDKKSWDKFEAEQADIRRRKEAGEFDKVKV